MFSQPRDLGGARFHQASESSEENAEETLRKLSEKVIVALPFSLVDWDKSVIVHLITCPFRYQVFPVDGEKRQDYPGELSLEQRKPSRNLIKIIVVINLIYQYFFTFYFINFVFFSPWIQGEHMV